jgi:segregation and condensation protein B
MANIKNIVEALIFSSDRPLTLKQLKDIINDEKSTSGLTVDMRKLEAAVKELMEQYESDEYSYRLMEIAGGYRFATKKEYAVWLARLNKEKLKRKLSQSALETLAIIAYNQPITKSEMEYIRGVNVDYIVGALLEKDLITIRGRAETLGRPMLFGTTNTFLEYMGVASVNDLPPLKAIEEIIKSGPPDGVSQSDIDFFEEINLIKARKESGESIELNAESTEITTNGEVTPESGPGDDETQNTKLNTEKDSQDINEPDIEEQGDSDEQDN